MYLPDKMRGTVDLDSANAANNGNCDGGDIVTGGLFCPLYIFQTFFPLFPYKQASLLVFLRALWLAVCSSIS